MPQISTRDASRFIDISNQFATLWIQSASLIATAKPNDVDPQAWLADIHHRIRDHPASRLDELLPWNWRTVEIAATA